MWGFLTNLFAFWKIRLSQLSYMKTQEPVLTEKNTRRKLLFGISLLPLLPLLRFGFLNKKKDVISCAPESSTGGTVKMLTEDGKLVEVDISKLPKVASQKISNKEVMAWVKK